MMISRYFASIVIMAALCFVQKSYGSTFCATASRKMTDSTAQLDKAQASKISNAILDRLKKGDTNQYVPLNEDTYMGLESLFPEAKLRAGRTFFINAWDLNRLLEMQSKLDLVVIGKLSSDQIRKVEKALVGTGIRLFYLTFKDNSDMRSLSELSGGTQIILPPFCD